MPNPTSTPPPRLHMELVPEPLWGLNLRAIMGKQTDWKQLRQALLAKQGLTCATCGIEVVESRALQAHEEWTYLEEADPAVAWLRGVSLICWHCHAAEHPGVLDALVSEGRVTEDARTATIAHFCRVNGVGRRQWDAQVRAARRIFIRRSEREWHIDYGPFTEWVVSKFETDPLNLDSWPAQLEQRWGGDHPIPTSQSIVESFAAKVKDSYPESPHGFLAWALRYEADRKKAVHQKASLKRKRAKVRLEREAAKAQ